MTMDLHRAFTAPAESGLAGEVTLQNGAGIDIGLLHAAMSGEKGIEFAQLFLDEVVVVVIPRVAGDAPAGMRGMR